MPEVRWLKKPEKHDYGAAFRYLSLHFPADVAYHLAQQLKESVLTKRADKDILRAAGLPLLPKSDRHVQKNLAKIKAGEQMVPILLVVTNDKTYIADGYHRVCALWHLDYDEMIPCQILWSEKEV